MSERKVAVVGGGSAALLMAAAALGVSGGELLDVMDRKIAKAAQDPRRQLDKYDISAIIRAQAKRARKAARNRA